MDRILWQAWQVQQRTCKSKKQEMPENSKASTGSTDITKVCILRFAKRNLPLFVFSISANISDRKANTGTKQVYKENDATEGREYKARIVRGSDSRVLG